jgi:pimeloyl-ACP methyl ester carboxylesterase
MSSSVVSLRNSRGHAVHCILEEPAAGAAGARFAALLLCSGVKTRVAPHRLYRKLAGPFLARGIPVLRVDFAGLGDSEGEWPDTSLDAIYGLTERGHCVDDVRSAFDWLEARRGIRRFIAGGLCGAAVTALHVATRDPRLAALYAIGLPATYLGSGAKPELTSHELRLHRMRYLRKLLAPSAWLRFLSMKSDYRLMLRMAGEALRLRKPAKAAPGAAAGGAARDLNPYVPLGLFAMLASGCPALVMFGEDDPLRYGFEERFMQAHGSALEQHKALFSYAVVAGANHILGEPGAVSEANRLTALWLDALLAEKPASSVLGWSLPARGAPRRLSPAA